MKDDKDHCSDLGETAMPGERPEVGSSRGAGRAVPPVLNWQRFELGRFLGCGGMGRVYEGRDYRLNRRVAVKFMEERNPERVARFLREARAQARVEHEHICKVHEVGEVEGIPYIAMQLIDGQPLQSAAATMTLEQKIQTLRMVVLGVHEAHRAGLIHRDVKPANIMVEHTNDGLAKPYLLDFGLARFGTEVDLTIDGTVMGTPVYMAPEQVTGEIGKLDRRTDVYGLGATLYHLLAGEPPFAGPSQGAVLRDILEKEPVKPSLKLTGIPRDVETITLKCLEKRPEARYDSALALAQDLGRYLDGEQILARPAGLIRRLRRKARKNKLAFSVAALASLLLTLTLGWGLHTAWQASSRERLARELTAQVKEIEALARFSHMSRLHDIRPDQQRLEQRMDHLRGRLDFVNRQGRGPAHYALGCGYLALDDLDAARGQLDSAWHAGYREPAVAHALGLVYSELYREQLGRVHLIDDAEARERRRASLAAEFRVPALAFMARARPFEVASPFYIEALVAYCENRFEDALDLLKQSTREQPWFYEAHLLEGDLYRDWARQMGDSGLVEDARLTFRKSLEAYTAASEIAQSDPRIYHQTCWALILMMHMETFREADLEPLFARGLLQVERALAVSPDDGEPRLLRARLYRAMAQRQHYHDEQRVVVHLEHAVEAAREACSHAAVASLGNLELSLAYWEWAQWLEQKKQANEVQIQGALDALSRVAETDREYLYFYTLGQANRSLANRLAETGGASCPSFREAIAALRNAIALRPRRIESYNSLANCFMAMARVHACPDEPERQLYQETVKALDAAIAINPRHPVLLYQSGRAYQRLACSDEALGWQLDEPLAAKAVARYADAMAINDKLWFVYNGLGWTHLLQAQYAWEMGRDPEVFYTEAIGDFERGIATFPASRMLCQNAAWVHYYRAKFRLRTGGDATAEIAMALDLIHRALYMDRTTDGLLCLGSLKRMQAEREIAAGGDATASLASAKRTFDEILARDEAFAEAHRSLGRLYGMKAWWLMRLGKDPAETFRAGRACLDRALELQPDALYFILADGRHRLLTGLWLHADGADAADQVETGLAAAGRALDLRPGLAEAQALRACLLALRAEPGGIGKDASDARETFQRALRMNPFLEHVWSPLFAQ